MTIRTYASPESFKQALEQRLRGSAKTCWPETSTLCGRRGPGCGNRTEELTPATGAQANDDRAHHKHHRGVVASWRSPMMRFECRMNRHRLACTWTLRVRVAVGAISEDAFRTQDESTPVRVHPGLLELTSSIHE